MARFPEVRLFRSDVNRHYALSNNRAIEHAREQYLYLLNNDTIVLPHALDRSPGFAELGELTVKLAAKTVGRLCQSRSG